MIITLMGADFSASNIGTLSSWRITRSLGTGATYEGATSVDKGAAFSATITIAEGYELGAAGVTVTMGGDVISASTINGNVVTITIAEVTGNVVIKVPTVNTSTGEEDSGSTGGNETTHYTITYKYVDASGTTVKPSTTESVAAGTNKTFTTANAPTVSGYKINSVSPTTATVVSNITVTYIYAKENNTGYGTVTFNGSEDWQFNKDNEPNGNGIYNAYLLNPDLVNPAVYGNRSFEEATCNIPELNRNIHDEPRTSSTEPGFGYYKNDPSIFIRFDSSIATSIATLKAYLAENNLTITYKQNV